MNKDQVKGRFAAAKGKVKQVAGTMTGNKTLKAKGRMQQTVGAVRAGYGDLKAKLRMGR